MSYSIYIGEAKPEYPGEDNDWIPTTFTRVPIGGEFIECLTTCNEIATRITPTTHNRAKMKNARRSSGKFIFMAEWEPVFINRR